MIGREGEIYQNRCITETPDFEISLRANSSRRRDRQGNRWRTKGSRSSRSSGRSPRYDIGSRGRWLSNRPWGSEVLLLKGRVSAEANGLNGATELVVGFLVRTGVVAVIVAL